MPRLAPHRVLLVGLLVLAACTTTRLPPVSATPTGRLHPGKLVWFDLMTENAAAARDFYGAIFGWTFEVAPDGDGYEIIRSEGAAIAGMAEVEGREREHAESLWLVSLSVEDVDTAVGLVEARGGELLFGPLDVAGRGRLAGVRDPRGAALVLLRASGGDPPDASPPVGSWLWTDLWTDDADSVRAFYSELVGYDARTVEVGPGHVYEILGRRGRARAGMVVVDLEGLEPNWLPYVRVADVARTADAARQRGGAVLLEREHLAILIDPTGAAIGIQEHPTADEESGS